MTRGPLRKTQPNNPFGRAQSAFNPNTGTFQPLGDDRIFLDATIVEVGHDMLLCAGDDGRQVLVAKPWAFRKSEWEGEDYVSTAVDERVAIGDEASVREKVTPAYEVGEAIVAMRKPDRSLRCAAASGELTNVAQAEDYKPVWEDMNTAGRRWEEGDAQRAEITAIQDNTLTVRLLEDCTAAGGGSAALEGVPAFTVWRHHELQRQFYDGKTIDGIDYAYSSSQERTSSGDAEETEVIVPRYYVGAIVYLTRVLGGAAPAGPPGRLIDDNRAGRYWSRKFE